MRTALSTSLARMLWKVADRLAELLPLERVGARGLVGALRQADGERRDADAAGIEHLQRVDEPLPLGAEQLAARARGSSRR